jgi:hypothetical protein
MLHIKMQMSVGLMYGNGDGKPFPKHRLLFEVHVAEYHYLHVLQNRTTTCT